MGHSLKLLRGDKRSPTRTLDLASTTGDGIYLQLEGFAPTAGASNVVYSGQSIRFDGEDRVASSRGNAVYTIQYDLVGGSAAEMAYFQREIHRFVTESKLWHEQRVGEELWLEYRWQDGLNSVSAPAWGQASYYNKILHIEPTWAGSLHSKSLIANNIFGNLMTITGAPYWEGLRDKTFYADGLPDTDSDVTMKLLMQESEFNSDWSLSTWITHRESDYYVFEYWVDSTDFIKVFWDESDSRFEIISEVSGTPTTTNGDSQSLSAGDEVHIVLVSDNTTDNETTLFVNGTEQTNNGTAEAWANDGTLYVGAAKGSASGTTANTAGLDALKLWTTELTAQNVTDLYNAESAIKTDGNTIGPPPYWKTEDGDGVVSAIDNTMTGSNSNVSDNWGVAGWIPGDEESITLYTINPTETSSAIGSGPGARNRAWWIGRRATTTTFTPSGTLWHDFDGTSDSGSSSGDAYNEKAYNGVFESKITTHGAGRGEFTMLARMSQDGAITANPFFRIGDSDRVNFETVSLASDATMKLRKVGDLVIDWPQEIGLKRLSAGVATAVTSGANDANEAISFWEMNESSGTRYDKIGSNNLTDNNTVGSGTGVGGAGTAADFEADNNETLTIETDDYYRLTRSENSFSFAVWINLETAATSQIITKPSEGILAEYVLELSGAQARLTFGSNNVQASTFGNLSTGTWYFIFAYFDAANDELGISVNDGTVDTTSTTIEGYIDSRDTITIGSSFDGKIDSLGIWDKKLSAAEVTALYNAGADVEPAGSVKLDFFHLLPKPNFKVTVPGTETRKSALPNVVQGRNAWYGGSFPVAATSWVYNYLEFEGDEVNLLPHHYNYLFYLPGIEDATMDLSADALITMWVTPRWTLPGGLP